MLGTFLDKLGGFFDRRFLVAYVIPTLILLVLIIVVFQILFTPQTTLNWWSQLVGQEQILVGVGVLLTIILLAYIFEMLTSPVVRLYEGYWAEGRLTEIAIRYQKKIKSKSERIVKRRELAAEQEELIAKEKALVDDEQKVLIAEQLAIIEGQRQLEERRAYAACYYNFPRDNELLKPTRLGNVLAAAEEYSFQVYRLDAVIWWPRLATLLPDDFRVQIDTALTPMLTVLNLSVIFILLSVGGGVALLYFQKWFAFILVFLGGILLGRSCYLAAINQAIVYGKLVRVAFDLYRQEILKQMKMSVPTNLLVERMLWDFLTNWHYYYSAPLELMNDLPELGNPFYYDLHQDAVDSRQQKEVMSEGFSTVIMNDDKFKKKQ